MTTVPNCKSKLLCHITILLEERLRLCFNNVSWDECQILAAKAKLRENPSDATSLNYIRNVMNDLRTALPLKKDIPDGLREKLDIAFKDHLQQDGVIALFGDADHPKWNEAYDRYKEAVVELISHHMEELEEQGGLTLTSQEVKDAYSTCAMKASFVLEYKDSPDLPYHVPFMSATVWDSLSDHLKRVSKTLLEVSSTSTSLSCTVECAKMPVIRFAQRCLPSDLRKNACHWICA